MTSAKNPEPKPPFLSAWTAEWEFAVKRHFKKSTGELKAYEKTWRDSPASSTPLWGQMWYAFGS